MDIRVPLQMKNGGILYVPIDDYSHGGGSIFVKHLSPYLYDFHLTRDITAKWDIAFLMGAECSLEALKEHVVPRTLYGGEGRTIFRLDGIKHTRMPQGLERMRAAYDLADVVVFQSKAVQEEAVKLWDVRPGTTVIYNGVDTTVFTPHKDRRRDFLYCEYSWKSHKKAQEAFGLMQKILKEFNKDATFTIVGQFPGEWVKQNFGLPQRNVDYRSPIKHKDMASVLRNHRVLLFPSENEPCSNLVLEAMASGTVVVHKDSGCMPELCGDTQVAWRNDVDCIDEALAKVGDLSGRKRVIDKFTVQHMVAKYLTIIGKML